MLVSVIAVTTSSAQETGTTVSLTVSPSVIDFGSWGGRFGAAVTRLTISRAFSDELGAELSAFAIAPAGAASAQPSCVVGASCVARTTPGLLYGIVPSLYAWAGKSDVRISAGAGVAGAGGGEGLDARNSAVGMFGVDWLPRSRNRLVPTVALRIAHLATPLAGARTLLLPHCRSRGCG
jgi:hypothetical protein